MEIVGDFCRKTGLGKEIFYVVSIIWHGPYEIVYKVFALHTLLPGVECVNRQTPVITIQKPLHK